MGCPCANPPGKGKTPVPRDPYTLKPINKDGPLSRNDIKNGNVKIQKPNNTIQPRRVILPMKGFVGFDSIKPKR